jgi:hypothetical protein
VTNELAPFTSPISALSRLGVLCQGFVNAEPASGDCTATDKGQIRAGAASKTLPNAAHRLGPTRPQGRRIDRAAAMGCPGGHPAPRNRHLADSVTKAMSVGAVGAEGENTQGETLSSP